MHAALHCRSRIARSCWLLLITPLALLSACTTTDPLYQSGHWQPTNVNQANLAVEIENPQDLRAGRDVAGSDAVVAAAAVARLRQDRVKKLPDSGLAQITLTPGASGSDALPGAGGGL